MGKKGSNPPPPDNLVRPAPPPNPPAPKALCSISMCGCCAALVRSRDALEQAQTEIDASKEVRICLVRHMGMLEQRIEQLESRLKLIAEGDGDRIHLMVLASELLTAGDSRIDRDKEKQANKLLREAGVLESAGISNPQQAQGGEDSGVAPRSKMVEAISNFINKLDECTPHINGAFQMAFDIRGHKYTGPNYADELKVLRQYVPGSGK